MRKYNAKALQSSSGLLFCSQGRDAVSKDDIVKAIQLVILPRSSVQDQQQEQEPPPNQPPPPPPPPSNEDKQEEEKEEEEDDEDQEEEPPEEDDQVSSLMLHCQVQGQEDMSASKQVQANCGWAARSSWSCISMLPHVVMLVWLPRHSAYALDGLLHCMHGRQCCCCLSCRVPVQHTSSCTPMPATPATQLMRFETDMTGADNA